MNKTQKDTGNTANKQTNKKHARKIIKTEKTHILLQSSDPLKCCLNVDLQVQLRSQSST